MKSFKFLAIVAIMAIVAVGCGKVEKILPKKDGRWAGKSADVKVYFDDVLTFSEVTTDSLGESIFEKDGTGTMIDAEGGESAFTWSVNDENDVITITDTSNTPMAYDILESEKDLQTWFYTATEDFLGTAIKTEITMVMERVK